MPDAKEMTVLVKAIRANGFKVVKNGRSHAKVLTKSGAVVVDANGPLILSGTPGDFRFREMHVKRLMAAGVLKVDPWKTDQNHASDQSNGNGKAKGSSRLKDPDMQAAKLRGIQDRSDRNAERSRKIRSRLEPLVVKLGGWDKHGMVADLGNVYYHYLVSRGRQEAPSSEASAKAAVARLKKGETLAEANALGFEIWLDDLERAELPQVRFFELMREAKGIVHGPVHPAAGSPPDKTELPTPPVTVKPFVGPASKPTLAMEALFYMSKAADSADRDTIITLAEKILELELKEQ